MPSRHPARLHDKARAEGGFESGIEMALRAMLASTQFLFRIERDPSNAAADAAYRISDLELASRLSFFLWSSVPDDELLGLAIAGKLRQPAVLEQQTRRMLRDGRSHALVTNFAGQWLYLRNLAAAIPDARLFPYFDDNLRQAFRQETELFFDSIVTADHNVLDLPRANYTFVNERLARHYGLPGVCGSRFGAWRCPRTASAAACSARQHPHSDVVRNHASPCCAASGCSRHSRRAAAAPAAQCAAARRNNGGGSLAMRGACAAPRDAACASCHQLMDPVGLSMNTSTPSAAGTRSEQARPLMPRAACRTALRSRNDGTPPGAARHPDVFVTTMTDKLMTYALGRASIFDARRSRHHA